MTAMSSSPTFVGCFVTLLMWGKWKFLNSDDISAFLALYLTSEEEFLGAFSDGMAFRKELSESHD